MTPAMRRRYGAVSGVKARLVSPHRLSRYTSAPERWEQGIHHDANGRPDAYRFRVDRDGWAEDLDLSVMAGAIQRIIHVMDRGATPNSPRGISPMDNEEIAIIPSRERGGESNVNMREGRRGLNFDIPHFPLDDAVSPADLQNILQWGEGYAYAMVADVLGQKQASTSVIFLLVPQARLRKKLNLIGVADRMVNDLPEAIAREWRKK